MIFVATKAVAASFPGRNPISSQARSKAIDIDRIVSGSNACPEKNDLIDTLAPRKSVAVRTIKERCIG